MAVYETNDAGLPDFICRHPKVIVKFTGKECPFCEELTPVYKELSEKEAYKDMIFLKLDAIENPVASREVKQHGTPFICSYRHGDLTTCKLARDEADIVKILKELIQG